MSEICGIFRLDGAPVSPSGIRRLLGDAAGSGVWAPESPSAPVGLGSRIVVFTPDDAKEAQPARSRDGQVMLVSITRLDNRAELARSLSFDAEQAAALPDSAFILAAYDAWGEECPRRLCGDFAFILWDGRRRTLVAARDGMGERVLFYHAGARQLSLATSVESLLRVEEVRPRLNEQKLADFLVLFQDPETTFFDGIRRLPAGHLLIADTNGTRVRRYWDLSFPQLQLRSDAEYVEAFQAVFTEAVRCRLRSVGEVGVMLSGGLDSSSVAAVSARELAGEGRRLVAFHSAPREGFSGPVREGWVADESGDVRAIVSPFGNVDLQIERPGSRSPLDCMDELFRAAGGPVRNPNNLAWIEAIYTRAAERGVRVLLVGHKGNSTISYTGLRSLRDLARRGQLGYVLREVNAVARVRGLRPGSVLKEQVLLPLFPPPLLRAYSWLRGNRRSTPIWETTASAINPRFAAQMNVEQRMREMNSAILKTDTAGGDEYRRGVLTSAADGPDLHQGFRGRFGVETRDPTADIRVIEFCLSIPGSQYLHNGQSRWLIRRAMRGYLPDAVLDRTTRGSQAADWTEWLPPLRGRLLADLAQLERSELACRAIDLPRLRRLLTEWPERLGIEHLEEYNLMLLRAIELGRFILWFDARYA